MEVTQAIKIVNECVAHQRQYGTMPVSKYDVINHYRRLAFKTLDEIINPGRRVSFKINEDVAYFDKNEIENLGFL